MLKKLFLMVVLLATTAFTVVLGEDFDFWSLFSTEPTTIVQNTSTPTQSAEYTATFTVTEEPTATEEYTATLEYTDTPEATATPENTATEVPTNTPTLTPTSTSTATPTEVPVTEKFIIQTGSPVFTANFAHPTQACAWQGIAGQVFLADGDPAIGYIMKLSGTYNGASVNMIGLTGLVTNTPYGPGSFEFVIGSQAIDTLDQLTLQLFDPTGQELTSLISIDTFASCTKNLQILNFVENN
jgi:hypothetical protein